MQKTSSMRETAVSPRLASMAKLQDAVEDSSESLDQTNISAVEGDQTAEGDQIAEPEEEAAKHELRSVESSHSKLHSHIDRFPGYVPGHAGQQLSQPAQIIARRFVYLRRCDPPRNGRSGL